MRAARAARRLPQLTIQSAGAICKRRVAMHLGGKEGLQPRERQTARRQLLAAVGLRLAAPLTGHLSSRGLRYAISYSGQLLE